MSLPSGGWCSCLIFPAFGVSKPRGVLFLLGAKGGEVCSRKERGSVLEKCEVSSCPSSSNGCFVSEEVGLSSRVAEGVILSRGSLLGEQLALILLMRERGDSGMSCDSSEGAVGEVTLNVSL